MESFMATVSFGKMIGAGWLAGWLAYLCNYGVKTPYGYPILLCLRFMWHACPTPTMRMGEVEIGVGGDVTRGMQEDCIETNNTRTQINGLFQQKNRGIPNARFQQNQIHIPVNPLAHSASSSPPSPSPHSPPPSPQSSERPSPCPSPPSQHPPHHHPSSASPSLSKV